jgi:hypothetical protein
MRLDDAISLHAIPEPPTSEKARQAQQKAKAAHAATPARSRLLSVSLGILPATDTRTWKTRTRTRKIRTRSTRSLVRIVNVITRIYFG